MKYKIPRNVKTGLSFMGLEIKGWLLFLPAIVLIGTFVFLFIPAIKAKFVIGVLGISLAYIAFKVDETSGVMNYTIFTELWRWKKSQKIVEPIFDESLKDYSTLKIKKIGTASLPEVKKNLSFEKGE